jgi:mono/diheme cytochrome c family protein
MSKLLKSLAICFLLVKMSTDMAIFVRAADGASSTGASGLANPQPSPLATYLGIEFVQDSTTTVLLQRDGKSYVVDLVARTIHEAEPLAAAHVSSPAIGPSFATSHKDPPDGAGIFKSNCVMCHGPDGKGIAALKTPNFTDPKVQASLTDQEMLDIITHGKKGTMMPAWEGKLSEEQIRAVQGFVRSLGSAPAGAKTSQAQAMAPAPAPEGTQAKVYEPGDDKVFTLPTGRRLDRHGFYINFTHRFAFDPAFSGTARGGALLGLDGFSLSSFGLRYGVTDKLSVSIYRSPSNIGRPIEMMAAYNVLDEHDGQPLNAVVRVSIDGLNDFDRMFSENIEGIFSRSITRRAQIYFVPTVSFNDRRLFLPATYETSSYPTLPGYNAVSLGVGGAIDIRPTVALVAEAIPTVYNGRPLGIHRPAYSFGIQKKIWRHAFTFGFTNSPGTTVSQRAGTDASYLGEPSADTPSGLFIGFDLTRQVY